MSNRYFNNFENIEDLHREFLDYGQFDKGIRIEGFPTDSEILFASYETGCYEGDSVVLFKRDGKLYHNAASHCSCYGLEGQWGPTEIDPAQLRMERKPYSDHGDDAIAAWDSIVNEIAPLN